MGIIKKKGDRKKVEFSLRYHLHKHLARYEEARTTKKVHASEMLKSGMFGADYEFCPREYALLDVLEITRPKQFIETSLASTHKHGNMVANWIVHSFADMGLAVGNWQCAYCEKMYRHQLRPVKCTDCEHTRFDYKELRFRSKETDASGGIDFFLLLPNKKLRPIELKTMKDEEFKKLAGPLAEHRWRTNLYLRIIADSKHDFKNRVETDFGIILYISKGGYGSKEEDLHKYGIKDGPFSPFKEFNVERDDVLTETKWQHAKRLKQFRDGKKGIPLGLCPTQFCKRAQGCSVREACFSGDYIGEE